MTTAVFYCTSGDCWADQDDNFDATGNDLYVISSVDANNVRTWIPFTVDLRRVTVLQAYLTVRASSSRTGSGTLRFSCEAADNPSTPANGAALNARTLSTFQIDISIGNWVADTEYTYQIDNPVQETFNRVGWSSGNTMAVIITDTDFGNNRRTVYSYEGNPSYRAYLTINYTADEPRIAGGLL